MFSYEFKEWTAIDGTCLAAFERAAFGNEPAQTKYWSKAELEHTLEIAGNVSPDYHASGMTSAIVLPQLAQFRKALAAYKA